MPLIPVLSREEMRAFDRHAMEHCRVPGLVLMENAGRGAADVVLRRLADKPGHVVVVAGPGNNGGDGFVVARRLHCQGVGVSVCLVSSVARLSGDARANHAAWLGVGGTVVGVGESDLGGLLDELARSVVVVDALFGTGLDREVTGVFAEVIESMNAAEGLRVALDVPSGLDANTGWPLGIAVRADETVTFGHPKLGLLTSRGAEHAGHVTVADIGVPPSLIDSVGFSARLVEPADASAWIPTRRLSVHKATAGRVLVIAGSPGKTGAALLVGRGALRGGAGTVTLCTFPDSADVLDRRVLEEMTARIDPERPEASLEEHLRAADVVVIGPGFGTGERARRVVDHVVLKHAGPVVVDADALTCLAKRPRDLRRAQGKLVLTPHPGELARLLGTTPRDIEADRFGALDRAVKETGAVVLLKGARTLVGAPEELPMVNPTGSPALATAGSGDVLSGILAALFASVREPLHAAALAAFVHGLAAERWVAVRGVDRGMVAHEIADGVPEVLASLTRR